MTYIDESYIEPDDQNSQTEESNQVINSDLDVTNVSYEPYAITIDYLDSEIKNFQNLFSQFRSRLKKLRFCQIINYVVIYLWVILFWFVSWNISFRLIGGIIGINVWQISNKVKPEPEITATKELVVEIISEMNLGNDKFDRDLTMVFELSSIWEPKNGFRAADYTGTRIGVCLFVSYVQRDVDQLSVQPKLFYFQPIRNPK